MNRQRGLSLIVVILALVIISFAATALLRSTDTATLITGNLAFKKAALASGDAAAEQALAWINASSTGTVLQSDSPANGYYSNSADGCDLTGARTPNNQTDDVNWTSNQVNTSCAMYALKVTPTGVASGYTVAYVINRMCNASGDPLSLLAADGVTPMTCARITGGSTAGSTRTGSYYGNYALSGSSQVYYRITTRITGPRNTVRYLQTFVAM